MNNNHSNKQEIICTCSGTTKAQIKELIDKGMDSLAKIANQTGASTGCGSCDVLIVKLLVENRATTRSKSTP